MWTIDPTSQSPPLIEQVSLKLPSLNEKWLCKVSQNSINEIAAYQLATELVLPVPNHHFFILSEPRIICRRSFAKNDPGLLIENINHDRQTNFDTLVREQPQSCAGILAFMLFDRHEHCQVLWSGASHWIIDFEYHFPSYCGLNEAAHRLALESYADQSSEAFGCCLKLAAKSDIVDAFVRASMNLLSDMQHFKFDFTGYPKGVEASEHFRLGIAQRTAKILKFLKAF